MNKMGVEQWLRDYCFPDKFCDYCKACPDYGKVWSCPPGIPAVWGYLEHYQEVFTIAVKVIYDNEELICSNTADKAEKLRKNTYGRVKRALLETLLYIEKENPKSLVLAAGSCEQCEHCTRLQGLPCRKPERMRYSFAAFGFDFTKLTKELFCQELLWSQTGLPEYNLAVAAFLIP